MGIIILFNFKGYRIECLSHIDDSVEQTWMIFKFFIFEKTLNSLLDALNTIIHFTDDSFDNHHILLIFQVIAIEFVKDHLLSEFFIIFHAILFLFLFNSFNFAFSENLLDSFVFVFIFFLHLHQLIYLLIQYLDSRVQILILFSQFY